MNTPKIHHERYVALGDSQTEGVGDTDETGELRGFADRLATRLARTNPDAYQRMSVNGWQRMQQLSETSVVAAELKAFLNTLVAAEQVEAEA